MGIGDIAVVDAGPVIHLFEIGALDLLAGWRQLLMPEAVWEETVAVRRVTAQAIDDLDNVHVVGVDKKEIMKFVRVFRLENLQRGEVEGLFLCKTKHVSLFFTDDFAAREAAKRLGIQPVGSLGIIVKAYHLGRLSRSEAENRLRSLHRVSSLFVTYELIEFAIRQLT